VLAHTLLLIMTVTGSGIGDHAADVIRTVLAHAPSIEREGQPLAVRYEEAARQVTNWRLEAADDLEPRPLAAFAALIQADRPIVTRCVRLNNYWCIKRSRWNGEIGSDAEGHVGFESAESGADAAALLLRRYYLDFGRRSALEIVRRWAPAECNRIDGPGGLVALAVKGIGATLRARYLASRRGGGKVRFTTGRPGGRVSAIIPRAVPAFRVPDIAVGMGEHAPKRSVSSAPAPKKSASSAPARRTPLPPKRTVTASAKPTAATRTAAKPADAKPAAAVCSPDEGRIRNYAARIVEHLDLGPTDDLDLFAPDGTPKPNLRAVMLAMSSVELGLLRASADLVDGAIERIALRPQKAETAQ
jgi:hypothetical protein